MGSRRGCPVSSRNGSRIGWALAVIAACAAPAAHAASDARILYFESLRAITADRDTTLRKQSTPQLRQLKFDAYGRRFELSLDANGALAAQVQSKSNPSSLQLYRGRLDNVAGSWVRLAVKNGSMQGMLWDGVDLYVIEPAARLKGELPEAAPDSSDTVIFRLADVVMDANAASCAVHVEPASHPKSHDKAHRGSQEYQSLLRELKNAPAVTQAAGAGVRLQISALGDAAFLARYASASEAREAILVRLNNVDGIFSSQLGVAVQAPAVFVNDAANDPLSGETTAGDLLRELGALRRRSPELNAHGLTHLFTGRDLQGDTVGIAYVNKLCDRQYGAGLTEVRAVSAWRDSLVAAHEIGHNFGASHDGDGACTATPGDAYLMASSVSGSDQFSQCSLDAMRPATFAAECISPLPGADIAVAGDLGAVRRSASLAFDWRLEVPNIGGVAAQRARAEIFVPPAVLVEDAYVVGGSCTSGAGVIFCELGDVPGGAMRAVNLTLRSAMVGTNSISARIASDNDVVLANNSGAGTLVIAAEADPAAGSPTVTPQDASAEAQGSQGGGGASSATLLLALLTLRLLRRP